MGGIVHQGESRPPATEQVGGKKRARRVRVLAIASSGGHWVQLMRLRPAFEGCDMVYVTAQSNPREDLGGAKLYRIIDANRWNKGRLARLAPRVLWLLLKERPDVIVSTGAAPGALAVIFGRLIGARTLWVDSIANAERLSMSGKLVRKWATLTLSQWPDVAAAEGVAYRGAVL